MESLDNIIKREKLLTNLLSNPAFFEIISPTFLAKSDSEQKELYKKIPQFKESNISIDDIINSLNEYRKLEKEILERKVIYIVNCIIDSQEKSGEDEGSWKKIELEEGITYNISPSNIWNNSALTTVLIKWKKITKDESDKLINAIEKGIKWLRNHQIQKNNYIGWAGPNGELNIYETGFTITTIINFKEELEEKIAKVPVKILIDDNPYFIKEEKLWVPEEGKEPDIGSSSYALLALMHYYKENYHRYPRIVEGIEGLLENSLNGGWGKGSKEKSDKVWIDRTCYALQTLIKYSKDASVTEEERKNIENKVNEGVNFLKSQLNLYPIQSCKFWSWLDDETSLISMKNSALTISILLKCGVPYYDSYIETGLLGLFKLLENKERFFNENEFPYFICTLADYLKAKL